MEDKLDIIGELPHDRNEERDKYLMQLKKYEIPVGQHFDSIDSLLTMNSTFVTNRIIPEFKNDWRRGRIRSMHILGLIHVHGLKKWQ